MYIWSTRDPAVAPATTHRCSDFVNGPYRFETLEGIGHWVPEQAANQVTALLIQHLTAHQQPKEPRT
jgi:pimeloyl-ACP methyl ester carboxylesterase